MTDVIPTDLVARIREHEGAYLFPKTADALLKEAADEIERLRNANAVLRAEMAHYEGQEDDQEALRRG